MSLRKDQDDHDADCSILNETPLEDLNDTSVVIVDTPPPPAPSKEDDSHFDHGYAWVIACLAFIVTAVVAINIVSFGVLLTEFADHFNLPYARLSLLAACRMGFTYISGEGLYIDHSFQNYWISTPGNFHIFLPFRNVFRHLGA